MVSRGVGGRGGRGSSQTQGGRGTNSSQGARRTVVSLRTAASRANVIPVMLPVTSPSFPFANASNIAHAMSNAAIQAAVTANAPAQEPIGIHTLVDVGEDQGPRSALQLLLRKPPPAGRPTTAQTRRMNCSVFAPTKVAPTA